ncbi:MAG TPA: flagellar brake protein [Steroidobacteraceae bacterium]
MRHSREDRIVVGKPLPFSVFGPDGQLLLAEGSVVESDRTRQMLLHQGLYRDSATREMVRAGAAGSPGAGPDREPLAALLQDYGPASAGHRFALSIAFDDSDESYSTWVIGAHDRSIILTAPRRANGSLAGVTVGQNWLCRAFQMTSAFRFRSAVLKVVFEPFPHVHIEAPRHVERRTVRGQPRAAVFLQVRLEAAPGLEAPRGAAVMVDLSLSGGRIAVANGLKLERGQALRIAMKLELIGSQYDLALDSQVIAQFGPSDGRHPRVSFYGIRFTALTEVEKLVLHSFVSGQLAMELNSLWQMLSTAVPSEPAAATLTAP